MNKSPDASSACEPVCDQPNSLSEADPWSRKGGHAAGGGGGEGVEHSQKRGPHKNVW